MVSVTIGRSFIGDSEASTYTIRWKKYHRKLPMIHASQILMLFQTVLLCNLTLLKRLNRRKVFGDDYQSVSVVLDIVNVTRTKIPGSSSTLKTSIMELGIQWTNKAAFPPPVQTTAISSPQTTTPSNADLKHR